MSGVYSMFLILTSVWVSENLNSILIDFYKDRMHKIFNELKISQNKFNNYKDLITKDKSH